MDHLEENLQLRTSWLVLFVEWEIMLSLWWWSWILHSCSLVFFQRNDFGVEKKLKEAGRSFPLKPKKNEREWRKGEILQDLPPIPTEQIMISNDFRKWHVQVRKHVRMLWTWQRKCNEVSCFCWPQCPTPHTRGAFVEKGRREPVLSWH